MLTDDGRRVAPACGARLAALRRERLEEVGLRKWSIPVVLDLAGDRRFGELRASLGASPRALSLALRSLIDAGVVERRVDPGYPPTSSYRLTALGTRLRRITEPLDRLATR